MSLPNEIYGDFYRKKIKKVRQNTQNMPRPSGYVQRPLDDVIGEISASIPKPTVAPRNNPKSFDVADLKRIAEKEVPVTEGDRRDAEIREMDARGDFWGATGARISKGFNDTVNQPVVQGLLDLLSTGGYATANIANEMTKSAERGEGPLSYVGDIFEGAAKGVSAGFGNKDDATTWADVINRIDYNMTDRMKNGDTGESDQDLINENMKDQTGGKAAFGLAGDILLDPLTYVGIGALKAVGGGAKAANTFKTQGKLSRAASSSADVTQSAEEIAKTIRGMETPEFKAYVRENGNLGKIRPTARRAEMARLTEDYTALTGKSPYRAAQSRGEAFKAGYNKSIDDFRDDILTSRKIKKTNKDARRLSKSGSAVEVSKFIETNFAGISSSAARAALSRANEAEGMTKVAADAKALEDYAEISHKVTAGGESPDSIQSTLDTLISSPASSLSPNTASRGVELQAPDGTSFTRIANPITGKFVRANAKGLRELDMQAKIARYATDMRSRGMHLNTIKANIRKKYPDSKLYTIGADGNLEFRNPEGVYDIEGQGTLFDDLAGVETPAGTPETAAVEAPETAPDSSPAPLQPEIPSVKESETPTNIEPELQAASGEALSADKAIDETIENIPELNEIRLENARELSKGERVFSRLADVEVPAGKHKYPQEVKESVDNLIKTRKAERDAAIEANKAIDSHNAQAAKLSKISGSVKDAPKVTFEKLGGDSDKAIASADFSIIKINRADLPQNKAEFDANAEYLTSIGRNVDFKSIALWDDLQTLVESLETFHLTRGITIGRTAQIRHAQYNIEEIIDTIKDSANRPSSGGPADGPARTQYGGFIPDKMADFIVKELGFDIRDSEATLKALFSRGPVKTTKGEPNVALSTHDSYAQPYLKGIFEKYQKEIPAEVLANAKPKNRVPVPEIVSADEIVALGVRPEDVLDALKGTLPVGDNASSSSIRHISAAIRAGNMDEDLVFQLGEILEWDGKGRITDFVAKELNQMDRSSQFQEIKKNFGFLGFTSKAKGTQAARNRGGAGSLALLGGGNDIAERERLLPIFRPATREEGDKFFNDRYDRAQLNIAHIGDSDVSQVLFNGADKIFKEMGVYQSTPAGPLKTTTGASVAEDLSTAKRSEQFNSHAQIKMSGAVMNFIRSPKSDFGKMLDAKGIKGKARWNVQISAARNMMVMLESKARLLGADIHAANFATKGKGGLVVRLSYGDMLDILPNDFLRKTVFGYPAFFQPTELMDIVELGIRSATRIDVNGNLDVDAVKSAILSGSTGKMGDGTKHFGNERTGSFEKADNTRRLNTLRRAIVSSGDAGKKAWYQVEKQIKNGEIKDFDDDRIAALNNILNGGKVGGNQVADALAAYSDKFLVKIVDDLLAVGEDGTSLLTKLVERNVINASAVNARLIDDAKALTDEFFENVQAADTMGKKFQILAQRPQAMAPDAQKIVNTKVDDIKNAEGVNPGEAALLERTQKRLKKQETVVIKHADTAKVAAEDATDSSKIATEELKQIENSDMHPAEKAEAALDFQENLFDTSYMAVSKDMMRKLAPVGQFFDSAFGSTIWREINQSSHMVSHLMNAYHGAINKWNKMGLHGEKLTSTIKSVQAKVSQSHETGVRASFSNEESQVAKLMSIMFDESQSNFFARNSVNPYLFNQKLEKTFGTKGAERYAIADPENFTQDMWSTVWTEWDIEDGGKFLEAFFHSTMELANDLSIGGQFSKMGRATPPVGEDWVRIQPPQKGEVYFLKLIDLDLYYPREFAQEIPFIEELMSKTRSVNSEFVKRVFDPVTSMLKGWQTTAKPGHHVMSIMGDLWRNSIAGMGGSAKEYTEALQILRKNGHVGRMGDNDPLDELNDMFNVAMGGQSTVSKDFMEFTVSANTKSGKVTRAKVSYKDIYDEMLRQGIAMAHNLGGAAEDFLTDFSNLDALRTDRKLFKAVAKVTTAADKPLNNSKWSLNKFAADRDSIMRGALYLNHLKKNMIKNSGDFEKASEEAANLVKKWAPLANDLGAGESKYLRRSVYFYTWLRGITPRILEFAATRPGMATLPAKLNYNMALAGGIQNESFGVPFPDEDKPVFASWYKEGVLGPQWVNNLGDMMGLNPTHPVLDVLNSLGSGITRNNLDPFSIEAEQGAPEKFANTLLGMSNPLLRGPAEIAAGRKLDTGAPIESNIQYALDYFMPAKEISRATGVSLEPGLPRRTESKYAEGARTDEEIQRDLGMQAINFLTGAGVTNYSSGQKSAEFQERDRLKREKDLEERFR